MNMMTKLLARNITRNLNYNRYLFCNSISLPSYTCSVDFHQSNPTYAGHSKWANIKHIKAEKDGQRSILFTRLTRQIKMSIQEGKSSNPATNSALKNAIEFAIKQKMPMSTIQNTIKKIETSKDEIKQHFIEIKAYNKIYMVCVLYTDNIASTKMTVAPIVRKAKGSYVDNKHLFDDMGVVEAIVPENLKGNKNLEETCTDDAIDVGAEEVEVIDEENGLVNFLCPPVELIRITTALCDKGYKVENAEHIFVPKSTVTVSEGDLKLYELLKEKILAIDGFERIFDNLDPGLES